MGWSPRGIPIGTSFPAERFALLAFHLDPRDGEAGELLKEIQQLRGGPPFEHVQFTDEASMHEDDATGYHGLPQTSEAVALYVSVAKLARPGELGGGREPALAWGGRARV